MKRKAPSLDSFFDAARHAPPAVPRDDAYRSFRLHSGAAPRSTFFLTSTRTYLVAGGAMAMILALAFLVPSLLRTPAQDFATLRSNNTQAKVNSDTSIRSKTTNAQVLSPIDGSKRIVQKSTKDAPTDKQALKSSFPIELVRCSPDEIDALRIFDLDSKTLRSIGIIACTDGSILRVLHEQLGWIEKIVENPDGLIRFEWESRNPATLDVPGKESAHPSDLRKVIRLWTDRLDSTGNPEPVLITNVRGKTFGSIGSIPPGFRGPDLTGERVDSVIMNRRNIGVNGGTFALIDLVPVRVRRLAGSPDPSIPDYYYIFWYEPTSEFLSMLPDKIRDVIRRARESREQRREKSKFNNALPTPLTLEACVYPNPVTQDVATVHYSLPEASRVAVSLYDITGTRMRELSVCESRNEGNWENLLSLQGVPAGMYLLAVTTERGEQAVQKIIVQR